MTGDEGISTGELTRRLDDFGRRMDARLDEFLRRLETVAQQSQERETRLDERFLPRVEYALSQQADSVQVRGLEAEMHKLSKQFEQAEEDRKAEVKEAAARRRQDRTLILSGFALPILVLLIGALVLSRLGLS